MTSLRGNEFRSFKNLNIFKFHKWRILYFYVFIFFFRNIVLPEIFELLIIFFKYKVTIFFCKKIHILQEI